MTKTALTLAALALGALTPARASATELKPLAATGVDLGSYRGSAYYTVEATGYRVVATLAALNTHGDGPPVIRLVTTLNPGQTVHLSVPGALGADGRDATIAFRRRGETVEVAAAD